ncbi:MAG: hypothetical protein ACE5NG_13020 [bacterium]
MKIILLIVIVLALLALDWAALHDILKKNEPNLYAEYGMIILSVVIFGIMIFMGMRRKSKSANIA